MYFFNLTIGRGGGLQLRVLENKLKKMEKPNVPVNNEDQKPSVLKRIFKSTVAAGVAVGVGAMVAEGFKEGMEKGPDGLDYVKTENVINGTCFEVSEHVVSSNGKDYGVTLHGMPEYGKAVGEILVTFNKELIDYVDSHPGEKFFLQKNEVGQIELVKESGEIAFDIK